MPTLDLPIVFPLGDAGSDANRRRLVLAAREKIQKDAHKAGLHPLAETFRVVWSDPVNGLASIEANRSEPPGAPS